MIIYLTTNTVNGKKYIGQDSNNNPNYVGSGKTIKAAIKKYGLRNFQKEILEILPNGTTKEELDEREIYYIEKFNAVTDKNFYNISKGGKGVFGYEHTNEHIQYMKNIERTDDWKNAISKSLTGVSHTKERIKNNSKAQIGLQAGNKNPRARTFLITSPKNKTYEICGTLKKFCKKNKLNVGLMLKVASGKQANHKKWSIKYLDGKGPYKKLL